MKYGASIRSAVNRAMGKLQVVSRKRNKSGAYKGNKRVTMRNKRVNGKTGRYSVTQGK